MEFDYTTTTTKTFDEAVQSVENEIPKAGMRVLYVHDVQKTLDERPKEVDQIIQNIINNAK